MSSILVTCRSKPAALKHYVPALRRAGWSEGIVLMSPGDSMPILEIFAGVLLTGGADIHPMNWNPSEPQHPKAEVDNDRDSLEIYVVRESWKQGIPILGICRGEQILNVALGGSLYQHVPEAFDCPEDLHRHGSADVPEVQHTVSIDPDSRLAAIVGTTELGVNSRHHQAVRKLAPELKAVAWHPESLAEGRPMVEALEAAVGPRFAIGVQWHPENLVTDPTPEGRASQALFEAFVAAVKRRL